MPSLIPAALAALIALALVAPASGASTDLLGTYYLTGVRETGGQLRFRSDGQFDFGLSYGAVDQEATGTWAVDGEQISLTTTPRPPPSFSWQANQPVLHELCMDEPEVPVVLAVCLAGPGPSIPSTEFKITAEFTNGLRRSGVPKRGRLYFAERSEPEWKDAKVKRLQMEVPRESVQTWIVVPPENRTAIIELASGRLAKPAFETAKLRILRRPDGAIAVVFLDPEGKETWMGFVKASKTP
ncbi:MAG: hypothetical protein KA375_03170 [Vitreoscilla sp.]|nr:hypothetical protein [Vitreoscilla sp.]MBP6673752.1 hypothetical protein [Vitreoscilla sp.]